jgi:tRNA(adenine34) deaminase
MHNDQASDIDMKLMDKVLEEAHTELATGGAGVAALLASPDEIIAVAHNTILETGDLTNHAEMVLLHGISRFLQEMDEQHRHDLTLYVTLEPCLMCSAALSIAGIKRVVYAALSEDANEEQMIVHNLTLPKINRQLVRGELVLVPGVRRKEGQALLQKMNKASGSPPDLKT